jgi:hypothetical protein
MTSDYDFARGLVLQGLPWWSWWELNPRPPLRQRGITFFSDRAEEYGLDPPRVGECHRCDCMRGANSAPQCILWPRIRPGTPVVTLVLHIYGRQVGGNED